MALDPTTTPHIPASATKPSVLFWDYQNTLAPPDVNTVKFGYEIMELASSLKPFKYVSCILVVVAPLMQKVFAL